MLFILIIRHFKNKNDYKKLVNSLVNISPGFLYDLKFARTESNVRVGILENIFGKTYDDEDKIE